MGRLLTRKKSFFISGLYFLIMGLFSMTGEAITLSVVSVPVSFSVSPSYGGRISPSGNLSKLLGASVVVTAFPNSGWNFSGWEVSGNITAAGYPPPSSASKTFFVPYFDHNPETFTIYGSGDIIACFTSGIGYTPILPTNPLTIMFDVIFFPHFIFESMMIIIGNKYDIAVFPTYEFVLDTGFMLVSLFFLYEWRKMQ